MKRTNLKADSLSTPELPLPTFGFGDVLKIADIPKWRLQNFLAGKRFQLSATGGQLGKGQGSRRLFLLKDLYRIAIADFLVRDGFASTAVSEALQRIEDLDLINFDETGRTTPPTIGFVRGKEEPQFKEVSSSAVTHATAKSGSLYYLLPLDQIVAAIDDRVSKWKKGEL